MTASNSDQQIIVETEKAILSPVAPLSSLKTHVVFRLLVLSLLFGICSLFYYFGELVDFAGWEAIRWQFFYETHDIHRLLFFAPILYACYFFGFKTIIAVTAASLLVFLPRAIFISPFPDPIPRVLFFVITTTVLCSFIRSARYKFQQSNSNGVMARNEQNDFAGIQEKDEGRVLVTGELEIDLSKRLIKRCGQIVKLTRTEYRLLEYLVRNSKKVMTTKEILHSVWGPGYTQEGEYVRNFIRQLRYKIENDPSHPRFIVTEPGFGYRFIEPESALNNDSSHN
jgi:DNA-binding winged helix-turn-helix (wHTH) protein